MMDAKLNLHVRYFASLREALGRERETVQAPCASVGALRRWLRDQSAAAHAALAPDRAVRCAVNQQLCDENFALQEGDEVAFFPPVTGG